jgi:hypothetical protein
MAGPERLFADRQRPPEQRLGFGIALLPVVEGGQIVQFGGDFRRLGAPDLLLDRQRAREKRLGIGILPISP